MKERQVEILRSNANRLKRLLQQILDFRKVESKKMEVNVSKSNLSSFVSGIVASNFQSLARKKNISRTLPEMFFYVSCPKRRTNPPLCRF